jgi:hypothetical protein
MTMQYTDQIANIAANATALTGMNAGIGSTVGPYSVQMAGRLVKVSLAIAGQAASSLMEFLRVDLACTSFLGVTVRVGGSGGALRTAPAFPVPVQDWAQDLPVNTSQGITASYLFNVAAVTPFVAVFGTFTAQG